MRPIDAAIQRRHQRIIRLCNMAIMGADRGELLNEARALGVAEPTARSYVKAAYARMAKMKERGLA